MKVESTGAGQVDAAEPAEPAAVSDSRPEYPSVGAANYGVVLLFLAYVLSFLDRNILSLLVGPIREQFGITDFQYSLAWNNTVAAFFARESDSGFRRPVRPARARA